MRVDWQNLTAAGLAVLAMPGTAVLAQDDVITITGDRGGILRDEAVQPIGVVGAADIREVAPQHPAELLNREAGVFINRGNGAEHLTSIRSPVLTGGAGAGSFLYLEDGVPLRAAGFANVNGLFEDIGRLAGGVEIFRGPGPALYGSNALHGLINTRTPDPEDAVSGWTLEAGSLGRRYADGRLVRNGENVSALMAFSLNHENGWRAEAGLDHYRALVRADGQTGRVDWRFTASLVQLNQETAGYIFGDRAYEDAALARGNGDPEAFRDARAVRMALQLETPVADGAWRLRATPYWRANEMDFLMHFFPGEPLEESGHASVGVQTALERTSARGRFVLGADIEHTQGSLRETQEGPTIFSFVQGDHYDHEVEAGVFAAYAQGRFDVSDRLSVQAGARLEFTAFDYDNRLPAGMVGRYLRLADRSDDFETFTPHLGFVWDVSDDASVFGRIARGARAPQTAELYRLQPGQTIAGIEPETLDSAELGWRRRFATEGRLEITGYAMRKRNVFFRDADGFNVTDGRTRHAGIEFEVAYPVAENVELGLTGSWARHQYDFDRPVGNASETIRKGDDVDTAPRWLWTGRVAWTLDGGPLRLSADWVHVGEYFTDAANAHDYDGHDLLHLRGEYRIGESWQVYGIVRNATDEAYAERADFAFGNSRYFPGEPRSVTIGFRMTR